MQPKLPHLKSEHQLKHEKLKFLDWMMKLHYGLQEVKYPKLIKFRFQNIAYTLKFPSKLY